jgi:hypothetical protein
MPRISAIADKKRKLLTIELEAEHEQRLTELPSATTLAERKMALHFAAQLWDGKRDVFENGPLLGGITRGLGMGMAYNEHRDRKALLHTYDWFALNQSDPLDLPTDAFLQLVLAGKLTMDEVNAAHDEGTFLPLFQALHKDTEYFSFLRPHVGYLPGFPGDTPEGGEPLYSPIPDREFSLLFVDGCKSWFGTKYWAKETFPQVPTGSYVLFQDHGQYTCFWITSLIAILRGRLKLAAYADHTYAYQILSPIGAEDVEALPEDPSGLDERGFEALYNPLREDAKERGDSFAVASLSCHLAAALAYIGAEDKARHIIDGLLAKVEYVPLRGYLQAARTAPTYRPDGERVLL